jgi:ribonuclease HII
VAAACVIPHDVIIEGVDDSKKLSAADRELLYTQLTEHPNILYGM